MTFYIYLHARPDFRDYRDVFYVGKGCRSRALEMRMRNPHHLNVINKYGRENIVVLRMACASEEEAFAIERELIFDLRKAGVTLVNQTDGGEGNSGYRWTEAQLQKVRGINKGLVGERHGMFGKGYKLAGEKHPRFGKPCPEHVRLAAHNANLGKTPWNKGKSIPGTPRPDEVKRRISASRIGMKWINKDGATKCVRPELVASFLSNGWDEGRFLKKQQAARKENHAISQ